MTTTQLPHHLKDRPKSIEQRAKIAASMRCDPEQEPERWQEEYEFALEMIRRRLAIDSKFPE